MNTLPPVPFDKHIQNLIDILRVHVPDINPMSLLFFDVHTLKRGHEQWVLHVSAIKNMNAMRVFFEHFCSEGREWIHLAGEGAILSGEYLISVDYSQSTRHSTTFVNLAGSPLNADGTVKQVTTILIVKDEEK